MTTSQQQQHQQQQQQQHILSSTINGQAIKRSTSRGKQSFL
jgi:hypothetical protein